MMARPGPFSLRVVSEAKGYEVVGKLVRNEEALDLREPRLMVAGGLVFTGERVARLEDGGAFPWLSYLRQQRLIFPEKDKDRWLQEILALDRVPPLELPDDLKYEELTLSPQFRLKIAKCDYAANRLAARLFFRYGAVEIPSDENRATHYRPEDRQLIRRDAAAERQALAQLHQLGLREQRYYGRPETHVLAARNLPQVVQTLTAAGWLVEADGKLYRQAGQFNIEVSSGIDWFELHGGMTFDDQAVSLPELLAAVRKGDTIVRLGDGSFGMLPEEWLKKYGLLAGTGKAEGDHLRFSRTQVGLLDALLAAQPEARCRRDLRPRPPRAAPFRRHRARRTAAELHRRSCAATRREGLGWLHFLRALRLRRLPGRRHGPGQDRAGAGAAGGPPPAAGQPEERAAAPALAGGRAPLADLQLAARKPKRFTPQLRVLDHTGIGREPPGSHFHEHDLILTTYGTLRRDVPHARRTSRSTTASSTKRQAIKNASSESAKAVRLLQARHRLALTGTPIENHLGELWSLFEFLNPGMLGAAPRSSCDGGCAQSRATRPGNCWPRRCGRSSSAAPRNRSPRTCPPRPSRPSSASSMATQRKLYNELRDHYRQSLLARVAARRHRTSRRCTCSKRCCGCARPPATPA